VASGAAAAGGVRRLGLAIRPARQICREPVYAEFRHFAVVLLPLDKHMMSQKAQSYTQYVILGDIDRFQAILPIGQSELPQGKSRLADFDLWSKGGLRSAPISKEGVKKITASTQNL